MSVKELLTPLQDCVLQRLDNNEIDPFDAPDESKWLNFIMSSYQATTDLDSKIFAIQYDAASGMKEQLVMDAKTEVEAFATELVEQALECIFTCLLPNIQVDRIIQLWDLARSFSVAFARLLATALRSVELSLELVSVFYQSLLGSLSTSGEFVELLEGSSFHLLEGLRTDSTPRAHAQLKLYKDLFCQMHGYEKFASVILNAAQVHYTSFASERYQDVSERAIAINNLMQSEIAMLSSFLEQLNLFEVEIALQKNIISKFIADLRRTTLFRLIDSNDLGTLKHLAELAHSPSAEIADEFKAKWQLAIEERVEWQLKRAPSFICGLFDAIRELNMQTDVAFKNLPAFSGLAHQVLQRKLGLCKNKAASCLAHYFHRKLSAHHKFCFDGTTLPEEIGIAVLASKILSSSVFEALYIQHLLQRIIIGPSCFVPELEHCCAEEFHKTLGDRFFSAIQDLIQSPHPSITGSGSENVFISIYRYRDSFLDKDETTFVPPALMSSRASYDKHFKMSEPNKKVIWCNALSVASVIFHSSKGPIELALTFYQALLLNYVCERSQVSLAGVKIRYSDIPESVLDTAWLALTSGNDNILRALPQNLQIFSLNMDFTTDSPVTVFVVPDLTWGDVAGDENKREMFTREIVIDSLIVHILKQQGECQWDNLVSLVKQKSPNLVDEQLIKERFETVVTRGFVKRSEHSPDCILYLASGG